MTGLGKPKTDKGGSRGDEEIAEIVAAKAEICRELWRQDDPEQSSRGVEDMDATGTGTPYIAGRIDLHAIRRAVRFNALNCECLSENGTA